LLIGRTFALSFSFQKDASRQRDVPTLRLTVERDQSILSYGLIKTMQSSGVAKSHLFANVMQLLTPGYAFAFADYFH